MAEIYKEKVIGNNKKARWPYNTTLPTEELYNTIMTRVKQEKIGYLFSGWKYNDEIYKEPFNDESTNPFGPISENTTIQAVWSKIYVYCRPVKTVVKYEGENVKIYFYAVTSEIITNNDVTLVIEDSTTASWETVSESVDGNYRVRTVKFNENTDDVGKYLYVHTEYNGVSSETIAIYQQAMG